MARTGGDATKRKILASAEKLFAHKGFDGTSIQDLARAAKVNKALIYYHFKNKQDIIDSLFEKTLEEMLLTIGNIGVNRNKGIQEAEVQAEEKITRIIDFLSTKKKILSVMLMESLKNDTSSYTSLFQFAEMIIKKDIKEKMHNLDTSSQNDLKSDNELMLHEFFTGFIPIVFFAIFRDKWAEYFHCEKRKMIQLFSRIFKESHIRHN